MDNNNATFKCPQCGEEMHYSSALKKLLCYFCGTTIAKDKYPGNPVDDAGVESQQLSLYGQEQDSHCVYSDDLKQDFGNSQQSSSGKCSVCGADLAPSVWQNSSFCPFCGTKLERSGDLKKVRADSKVSFKIVDPSVVADNFKNTINACYFFAWRFCQGCSISEN